MIGARNIPKGAQAFAGPLTSARALEFAGEGRTDGDAQQEAPARRRPRRREVHGAFMDHAF